MKLKKKMNDDASVASLRLGAEAGRKFRMGRLLGKGAFGECYAGTDVETGERVAIKIEHVNAKHPQLGYESKIYVHMQGAYGVPKIHHFGREGDYHVMVVQRLRRNLQERMNQVGGRFSMQTTTRLIVEMLHCVEALHQRGIVHRDLKPENFMVDERDQVYLIDYGLSKCFRPRNGEHIPFRNDKHLVGTPRYASINNHRGFEQSCRDDLESLAYIVVFMMRGALPWMNIKNKSKHGKYQQILKCKVHTTVEELCNSLPYEYCVFLKYAKHLTFDETPNYKFLNNIFSRLLEINRWGRFTYDWRR